MCNPNYRGKTCGIGVSARVRVENGPEINMECGENTFKARGKPNAAKTACACNALSVNTGGLAGVVQAAFTNDSCECATVEGEMCAGHGVCEPVDFPYGMCSGDYAEWTNDPLYTPFIEKSFPPEQRAFTLKEGSLLTSVLNNVTFVTLADADVYLPNTYAATNNGSSFSTCDSDTKYVAPSMYFFHGLPPMRRVTLTLNVWQLSNMCDTGACPCDVNGDLTNTVFNPDCIDTTVTIVHGVNSLFESGYQLCRDTWESRVSEIFFNDDANDRRFDSVRACVHGYTVDDTTDRQDAGFGANFVSTYFPTANLTHVRMLCANATAVGGSAQSAAESSAARFGTLSCNNVVHRIVDVSLRMSLGENYVQQCPGNMFSNALGALFGLFRTAMPGVSFLIPPERWTGAQYTLISQVFNNVIYRKYNPLTHTDDIVDVMSERILAEWVRWWTAPSLFGPDGVNNASTILSGTFTNYTELVKITPDTDLLSSFISLFGALPELVYDFLDERVSREVLRDTSPEREGSPYRSITASINPNRTIFDVKRNWTNFYREPGLAVTLPVTYRTVDALNTDNVSTIVNAVRITFPVDLDYLKIQTRKGRECAVVIAPRKGDVVDVSCGEDPFDLDDELLAYFRAYSDSIDARFNGTTPSFQELIEVLFEVIFAVGGEGMRVKAVPKKLYAVSPNATLFWTVSNTYGNHTFGFNQTYDFGGIYFSDWMSEFGYGTSADNTTLTGAGFETWFALEFLRADMRALTSSLVSDVLENRALPTNDPLARETDFLAARDGWTVEAFDPYNEEHQEYARNVWFTYLAPARCTTGAECDSNGRGSTCIADTHVFRPWRTGASSPQGNDQIGDEGGCRCDKTLDMGYRDDATICITCVPGYGPDPNTLNNPDELVTCSLPFSYDVRCGPGSSGETVFRTGRINSTARVITDDNGRRFTPRCMGLRIGGTTVAWHVNDTVDVNVNAWVSEDDPSFVYTAIGDVLYLNGTSEADEDIGTVECLNDFFEDADNSVDVRNWTLAAFSRFTIAVLPKVERVM